MKKMIFTLLQDALRPYQEKNKKFKLVVHET
jgi:hypothetical protein